MPARLSTVRRTQNRITPEAVAIYQGALKLDPDSDEFVAKGWALHKELGLKPWNDPPLWTHGQPDMEQLRQELEAAIKEQGS